LRKPIVLLFILTLCATAACAQRPKPTGTTTLVREIPTNHDQLRNYPANATIYTIGPFDRISLNIWRYEDLSGEVTVKEDGTVFIPNVGLVPLGGLTLREAQISLTRLLAVYVNDPQVDVQPVEVRSKLYYVTGALRNPGAYPIYKPITLAEAITVAGGTEPEAVADGALFSRGGQVYPIDLSKIYSTQRPIYLTAGDLLYVPSRADANVFVVGEVFRPGAYPLFSTNGPELLQAIAQAGGYTPSADENEVAIIRRNGEQLVVRVVDIKAALRGKASGVDELRLLSGDIIWVPPSGMGNWNRGLALIGPTLDTVLFRPLTGIRDYFLIRDLIRR
jgi:polysaccharide biosynthesis/export protein